MSIINQIIKPQVIYTHKETTNQSFIDMHNYLKMTGIKNNDFFLALFDSGLAGVDPRDPNLSAEMKGRVLIECQRNYWYFIREVVRIPQQGGQVGSGARYKLHRGNLAMNFLFVLNFNQFVELPRQHGKTTAALVRYLWVYNFGTSNSEIMFMHKDHTGSKNNLKNLRTIRDALPSYLQMSSSTGVDGKKLKVPNTVVTIEHPYNHNKIITFPSARTKDSANSLGRGSTQPLQYYDEFAFIPFNKIVYLAATPAFSTASKNAAYNNAPYGMLLTTTPGDLLTDTGQYAYDIRNNATPFKERFYDYTYDQLMEIRKANTYSDFFMISYTYQQLGSGQEYFNQMVVQMNREWAAIRREVMLEWAEIATDCPFSQEDLDIIRTHLKQPIRQLDFGQFGQYTMNIYEDIDLNYPPIIGVDVSGATYNDSSAITIIDSKTTRVCATLNCNYIPTDDLANVIYNVVTKYMPNAIINIERNGGYGSSVVQRLLKTSVKGNLYWEIKEKVVEESFNGYRMEKRPKKVKVYGLDSTKNVRARLIEILQERVRYHKDKFIAPIIHAEMQSMQVKKSGKVEHSDNSHDDQVFSYLMALYVWYDGHDLAERYHIFKSTLKTDEDIDLEELNVDDYVTETDNVDLEPFTTDNEDYLELLQFIEENSKFITTTDMRVHTYEQESEQKNVLLSRDIKAREAYHKAYGTEYDLGYGNIQNTTIQLPDHVFDMDIDDLDEDGNPNYSYLQGNLSDLWMKL